MLRHFDGVQVGLTATPCVADPDSGGDDEDKAFVRDTLRFFEVDAPTFSYKLKTAIRDGYLVPYQIYKAQTVKTAAQGGFEVKKSELDWSAMDAETRAELEIEQRFAEFNAALEWFKSPQCPLRQVTVEHGDDLRCIIATFGTTKVVLRLHLVVPEDGVAAGQVICTRSQPKLGVVEPMITSFTFDAQGRTSFEVGADGDPIEMGQHAVEIVMHILEAAARPIKPDISPFGAPADGQNANARL